MVAGFDSEDSQFMQEDEDSDEDSEPERRMSTGPSVREKNPAPKENSMKYLAARFVIQKYRCVYSAIVGFMLWHEMGSFLLMVGPAVWITQVWLFLPFVASLQLFVVLFCQGCEGKDLWQSVSAIFNDPLIFFFGNFSYLGLKPNNKAIARFYYVWICFRNLLLIALFVWGWGHFLAIPCESKEVSQNFAEKCQSEEFSIKNFRPLVVDDKFIEFWQTYFEWKQGQSSTDAECLQADVPEWLRCESMNATSYAECMARTEFSLEGGCIIDSLLTTMASLYHGEGTEFVQTEIRARFTEDDKEVWDIIYKVLLIPSVVVVLPFFSALFYMLLFWFVACCHLDEDDDLVATVDEHVESIRLYMDIPADLDIDTDTEEVLEIIEYNQSTRCFLVKELVSFYSSWFLEVAKIYFLVIARNHWFTRFCIVLGLFKVVMLVRDDWQYTSQVKGGRMGKLYDNRSRCCKVLCAPLLVWHAFNGLAKEFSRSRDQGLETDRFLRIVYREASANRTFSLLLSFYAFPFITTSRWGIATFCLSMLLSMRSIVKSAHMRSQLGVDPLDYKIDKYRNSIAKSRRDSMSASASEFAEELTNANHS